LAFKFFPYEKLYLFLHLRRHQAAACCHLLKVRKRAIQRLSRNEEQRLIQRAYRDKGERGLLIKTLFQTGARVSEFVNVKVEDFFLDEAMILISKGKGGKSRYVPILPELAQELRTHLESVRKPRCQPSR